MKSIIILGDGMADEPIEALGGKTPMQYADTPYMDKLAEMGVTGRMKTVADGFHPGEHGSAGLRPPDRLRRTGRAGSGQYRI
jgi:2,3-bisphosphoglycerate-independent phosphoglycerate mutase